MGFLILGYLVNINFIYFSFTASNILILAFFFAVGLISFFYYKNTLPQISKLNKTVLALLRAFAIFFILLTFFELLIGFTSVRKKELATIFLFDNSKSINSGLDEKSQKNLKSLKQYIEKKVDNSPAYQLRFFNGNISDSAKLNFKDTVFTGSSTNISSALLSLQKLNTDNSIQDVVLITDGIYNEGDKPIYAADELKIPIYTIALGDSSQRKDLVLDNIFSNELLYFNNPTQIRIDIKNTGYKEQKVTVGLFANNQLVEKKEVILSNGFNELLFDFLPKDKGEIKLTAKIDLLKDELSDKNNSITKFISVLDNKMKILLIAPAPSNDFGFIINSFRNNADFEVRGLIEKQNGDFYPQYNNKSFLDSAQALFLIGYPGINSTSQFLSEIKNTISKKSIPIFILISDLTDFNKLNFLKEFLPFNTGNLYGNYSQVFIDVTNTGKNEIMDLAIPNSQEIWNTLPPIFRMDKEIIPKTGSEVLANFRIQNTRINLPLISRQNLNKQKSIAFLGFDIWRLKLNNASKNNDNSYFDIFLNNCVKWLTTIEVKKQFTVKPSKKIFDNSDKISFIGQLYDQSNNPVSNAEVSISIKKNTNEPFNSALEPLGNGLYKIDFENLDKGDYKFIARANYQNQQFTDEGLFNITETELEYKDLQMKNELLMQISHNSSGKYYHISEVENFIKKFDEVRKEVVESDESSEIRLWNSGYFLALIILLLATEWFLRKRLNLL